MKPGCLIKSLIVSTVLVAVAVYIFHNHGDEYIKTPLIKFALEHTLGDVKKDLTAMAPGIQKDSLVTALDSYVAGLYSKKVIQVNELKQVADSLTILVADQKVTSEEAQRFINFLNELKSK